MHGEVHCPTVFGTPMPVEYILVALAIEIPVDITPKSIDAFGKRLFLGRTVDVILVYGKQSLYKESCFYEVATVVFLSERLYLAGVSIPPVRIGTVEAVGFFKERDYLFHTRQTFFTSDVVAVDT